MLEIKGAEVDPMFEKLYHDYYPSADFEPIKTAANTGQVVILQVFFERVLLGYLVARMDVLFNGAKELAVIRALAIQKGRNPIEHILSHGLKEFGKRLGVDSVRIHSDTKGLTALAEEAGYEFLETVLVARLKNV